MRLHIKITPEGQTPAHLAGLGGGSSTGRVVAVVPIALRGSSGAARDRIGVVISVALGAEQPGCALRIGVALSCTRSQVGRAVVIASCDLYVAVGAFVDRSHAVVGVASATGDVSDAVGIWVVVDHLFEHGTVGRWGGDDRVSGGGTRTTAVGCQCTPALCPRDGTCVAPALPTTLLPASRVDSPGGGFPVHYCHWPVASNLAHSVKERTGRKGTRVSE